MDALSPLLEVVNVLPTVLRVKRWLRNENDLGCLLDQLNSAGHTALPLSEAQLAALAAAVHRTLRLIGPSLGFESLRNQSQSLGAILNNLPVALRSAFQLSSDTFSSPVGYVAARSLSLLWPLLMLAFAAGAGASIAAMVERGTIHYELNLPLSRVSWLSSRLTAALLSALGLVFLTGGVLWASVGVSPWGFMALSGAFSLFWLGVSFLAASVARERGAVYSLTLGFFALSFLMTTVGRTVESLSWLERFSIWSLYTPEAALKGGLDGVAVAVLTGSGLLLFGLASLLWKRRDLPA